MAEKSAGGNIVVPLSTMPAPHQDVCDFLSGEENGKALQDRCSPWSSQRRAGIFSSNDHLSFCFY
jgi:hypothetical protein